VQPYVKNLSLALCPDNPWNTFITSANVSAREMIYGNYGFNFIYLGNFVGNDPNGNGNYLWTGIQMAGIGKPANVVMAIDCVGPDWADPLHATVYTQPIGPCVQPPDAQNSGKVSFGGGWGNQSDYSLYYDYPGFEGVAWRHSSSTGISPGVPTTTLPTGGASTLFCDGHAKFYRCGGLVAGTNYQPNQPGSAVYQVDKTQYLWDPRNIN
jgi:prepilin-type processing-associated H-X9-DG protein